VPLPLWRGPPLQYLVWMPGCVCSPPTTVSSNAKPAWVNRLTLRIGVPPLHIERDEMQLPSSSPPREEASIIQLPLCGKYHHCHCRCHCSCRHCHCRCRHSTAPQPNHIVTHSQSATKEEKRGVGGCFSHQLQQQVG